MRQIKNSTIIQALDMPIPSASGKGRDCTVFEECFGIKREGGIKTKFYVTKYGTSAMQLQGAASSFQLWINDDVANYCRNCGYGVIAEKLSAAYLLSQHGISKKELKCK